MHPSFYLARCATLTRCARPVLAALGLTVAAVTAHAAAPQDLRAGADAEVVERLPERVGVAPATPQAAATAARRWITLSRDMADPRYLGRAQAALAPWWGQPGAPAELLVLQATVEQARHEFTAARATLERALQANPAQVQGWLTLATLERVAARYPAAENACRNVARHGATMYAAACTLETRSLQGQHDAARSGLTALAQQLGAAPAQRAWVLSLLAESEERAGRDDAAEAAYRRSLADVADGYTALAYADHLLRRGRASAVLDVLRGQPASDAVLLRRAYALRLLGDDAWRPVAAEVQERFAAIAQRGEGLDAHARERALMALWLDARPDVAWQAARTNLTLQKEPLDWWLALQASEQSRDTAAHRAVVQALAQTGLQDARLARWQPQAATKTSAQGGQ